MPLLVLWTISLAAYANSFRDGLLFDSRLAVVQDTRIQKATAENIHLILTEDYWYKYASTRLYRPLTTLSYLFNYTVLGDGVSPAGYHWFNLALHAVNAALLYALGWLIFAELWPAFALAALWAVHPLLTEAVTNVVGRADLLAAFGVLAAVLCYERSLQAQGRRAALWLLALAAAVALGVFSKENGVMAIAAVFLYDIAFRRTAPLRARIFGYVAAGIPVVAFLLVRQAVIANLPLSDVAFTDNPLTGAGFLLSRLAAIRVLGKYLALLVWPASLSADYSFNQIPVRADWAAFLALAICAALFALALYGFRRAKPVFFFLAFFFATLAPTANIAMLIGTIMAERFLYLPSIGFLGAAVWAGWAAYQRIPKSPAARFGAAAVLAVLIVALGARTFVRNFDWYDDRSFWTATAQTSPNSYKAHQALAVALASDANHPIDPALVEIDKATEILAQLPARDRVPNPYAIAGQYYRTKAAALGSNGGDAWYRKGLDLLLEGERADVARAREFERINRRQGRTISVNGWFPLYLELGRTYRALGKYQDALDALAYGQQIGARSEFFDEISLTYQAMGESGKAATALLQGVLMSSEDQKRFAAEVLALYRDTAPQSCAIEGNTVNFTCPMVRDHLCGASQNAAILYKRMYRFSEAASVERDALQGLGCPAALFR